MGFRQFMKFRDEFADINWWPLGNLKQWRLHTHKQTGQFVILQHCLPSKFRSQNMSRYLEGLRRRLWVAQSDPHEWVKVGDWAGCSCSWCSYTICMHNYIYKTTCIYDYHIYLYIYIYMYLIGNRICTHFLYRRFLGFFDSGRRSSLRCSGLRCFSMIGLWDLKKGATKTDGLRFGIFWEWIDTINRDYTINIDWK